MSADVSQTPLEAVRIRPLETAAFLALVEAIAAKHERRRLMRRPELEPEGDEEICLYV